MCLCAEHFDAGESLVSVHLKVGVWEHTEEAAGECGRQCCDPRALAAVWAAAPESPVASGSAEAAAAPWPQSCPQLPATVAGTVEPAAASVQLQKCPALRPVPTVAGPGHPTARSQ